MKVSLCKGCRVRIWEGWHDECPDCGGKTAKTRVLEPEKFNPVDREL
jgi:rRNA maturation endonuclease Nob1